MSVFVAGGFGEASTSGMSDSLRIRSEADDQLEAERAARADRRRAERAERLREVAVQASIAAAIDAGENVNLRQAMANGGVGHTPAEFIAARAVLMDAEDAHLEAQQAAEYRRWQAEHYAATSADTSAPTAEQVEASRLEAERHAHYKDQMITRRLTLRQAREQAEEVAAAGDRQVIGRVAAAAAVAFGSGEAGYQTGYRMS
jgi:hypothetical protein